MSDFDWAGAFGKVLAPVSTRRGGDVTDESALSDDSTPGFSPAAPPGTPTLSKGEIARITKQVRDMIAAGRQSGWTLAAENLEDWLEGRYAGNTKEIPAGWFDSEAFVRDHLRNNHRKRILAGAERRLISSAATQFPASTATLFCGRRSVTPSSNTLKPTGPDAVGRTTIYWEDSVIAPSGSQLYYALGGFTVLSTVRLSAKQAATDPAAGWIVDVEEWTVEVCDRYNWDKGKQAAVPLFGTVQDDDMAKLERHGPAAPYDIVSKPWTVTDPELVGSFGISL